MKQHPRYTVVDVAELWQGENEDEWLGCRRWSDQATPIGKEEYALHIVRSLHEVAVAPEKAIEMFFEEALRKYPISTYIAVNPAHDFARISAAFRDYSDVEFEFARGYNGQTKQFIDPYSQLDLLPAAYQGEIRRRTDSQIRSVHQTPQAKAYGMFRLAVLVGRAFDHLEEFGRVRGLEVETLFDGLEQGVGAYNREYQQMLLNMAKERRETPASSSPSSKSAGEKKSRAAASKTDLPPLPLLGGGKRPRKKEKKNLCELDMSRASLGNSTGEEKKQKKRQRQR